MRRSFVAFGLPAEASAKVGGNESRASSPSGTAKPGTGGGPSTIPSGPVSSNSIDAAVGQ